jgi:hypothetical protein
MKILPDRYLGPKMNSLADSCKVINAGYVKQRYQTIYNRDGEEGLEPERVKYLEILNRVKSNYGPEIYQAVLARGDDSRLSQPSCLYDPYYPNHNEGTEALLALGGDALFRLALIDDIKQLQREADEKEATQQAAQQAAQQAVEKVIKWEKAPPVGKKHTVVMAYEEYDQQRRRRRDAWLESAMLSEKGAQENTIKNLNADIALYTKDLQPGEWLSDALSANQSQLFSIHLRSKISRAQRYLADLTAKEPLAYPKKEPLAYPKKSVMEMVDQNKWFILAGAAALFMVLRRR